MSLTSRILAFPRPYPYHKIRNELVGEGYNESTLSTIISDQSSNTISGQSVCRNLFYFEDGTLHDSVPEKCIKSNPDCANITVVRKGALHGKYLVIIPCNSGAMVGDYFTKRTWHNAARWFPERTTTLDFGAVDSITTGIEGDTGGLIVFEHEMDRVLGYDIFPVYSGDNKEKCKKKFEESIPRLLTYERIFVLLNVRLYDETLRECALPNMEFVDVGYKQGYFAQQLPTLRQRFDDYVEGT